MDDKEKKKLFMKFMLHQLIGTLIFIGGVICCYHGVLRNKPWFGPLVIGIIAIFKIATSKSKKKEIILFFSVLGITFLLETASIAIGIYTPNRFFVPAPICPTWILALWGNFALKLKDYLFFMRGKTILNATVGFVFGLMIFNSVHKMGLGTLNHGHISLILAALSWGIIVPILFIISAKLFPPVSLPNK